MIEVLDTLMIQDEDKEIKHIFAQFAISRVKKKINLEDKTLINNNMLMEVYQAQEVLVTNCIKWND